MLPDEVREAVDAADRACSVYKLGFEGRRHWQAIKAHLLAREAEVERVNVLLRVLGRTLGPRVPDCCECEGCRHEWQEALTLITAHLSENSRG